MYLYKVYFFFNSISIRVLGFGTFEIQITEICDCECEATGVSKIHNMVHHMIIT